MPTEPAQPAPPDGGQRPPAALLRKVADVPGVGPRRAEMLARIGVRRVGDLIMHVPFRYERRLDTETVAAAEAILGDADRTRDQISVTGEIVAVRPAAGRRPRIEATLEDDTGRVKLTWFNAPWLRKRLHPGMQVRCTGKLERIGTFLAITNPKWEPVEPAAADGQGLSVGPNASARPASGPGSAGAPHPTAGPLAGQPADQTADQTAGQPANPTADQTADQTANRTASQTVSQTADRPTGHAAPPPAGLPGLQDVADASGPPAEMLPVYAATEGLPSRMIGSIIRRALPDALPAVDDHLPPAYRDERDLPALAAAIATIHDPADQAQADAARRRLAFDELLLLQLAVMMKRAERTRTTHAVALPRTDAIAARIESRLPFQYTDDQRAAVLEIAADLARPTPMNRLLQGDVGAGKTVVALDAMLVAVAARRQAALVAPTELLAEQHERSLRSLLDGSDVRLARLTGSMAMAERRAIVAGLASGEFDIVVGTHALLGEGVQFAHLSLVVVDEQHRFGVHQRAALRDRGGDGSAPHVLVMTATPIPRTLAMTVFGDLDVSVIRGLPPGRTPIRTELATPDQLGRVQEIMGETVDRGEQVYVVVPAVEGDDDQELTSVSGRVAQLEAGPLHGRRIAGVHGRLSADDRAATMDAFHAGEIDVLVATTVIEVGVDVANATLMVVEDADRFGLAQLHQLRGRVGRGDRPGRCLLVADPATDDGTRRLEAIAATTDGFEIAEADLLIRGPGEVFGTRQSGLAPFRVADLVRDRRLLTLARKDAEAWIDRSPELRADGESLLRSRVLRRHGRAFGLGDVG
ncbi:MAG: helicase-related protein [Phycisphaerales bacterium]